MAADHTHVDVQLHDGQSVRVPEPVWVAISYLNQAIRDLATGVTEAYSLVEIDGVGHSRRRIVSLHGDGFDKLSAVLAEQSKNARNIGTLWEGNAPEAARSFDTH